MCNQWIKTHLTNFYSQFQITFYIELLRKWGFHILLYCITTYFCIITVVYLFKDLILILLKSENGNIEDILIQLPIFMCAFIYYLSKIVLKIPYPFYVHIEDPIEFRSAMNSIGVLSIEEQINEARIYGIDLYIFYKKRTFYKNNNKNYKPYVAFNTNVHSLSYTKTLLYENRLFVSGKQFNSKIKSIQNAINQRVGKEIDILNYKISDLELNIKSLQICCMNLQEENRKLKIQVNTAKASAGKKQKAILKKELINKNSALFLSYLDQYHPEEPYTHAAINEMIEKFVLTSDDAQKLLREYEMDFEQIAAPLQKQIWSALPASLRKGPGTPKKRL